MTTNGLIETGAEQFTLGGDYDSADGHLAHLGSLFRQGYRLLHPVLMGLYAGHARARDLAGASPAALGQSYRELRLLVTFKT